MAAQLGGLFAQLNQSILQNPLNEAFDFSVAGEPSRRMDTVNPMLAQAAQGLGSAFGMPKESLQTSQQAKAGRQAKHREVLATRARSLGLESLAKEIETGAGDIQKQALQILQHERDAKVKAAADLKDSRASAAADLKHKRSGKIEDFIQNGKPVSKRTRGGRVEHEGKWVTPSEAGLSPLLTKGSSSTPASLQEMDWLSSPERSKEELQTYWKNKRASKVFAGGGGETLALGAGGDVTTLVDRETAGANEAATAVDVAAGKQAVAESGKTFEQLTKVGASIANHDRAIEAIDKGADTGVIAEMFPDLQASTIELRNIGNNMGLDVIGMVTFGALSAGEMALAMSTAMPKNLNEDDLRDWLVRRRDAQTKLAQELKESAIFLNSGGTIGQLLQREQKSSASKYLKEARGRKK